MVLCHKLTLSISLANLLDPKIEILLELRKNICSLLNHAFFNSELY